VSVTLYTMLGFDKTFSGLLSQEATKNQLPTNKDNSCSGLYVQSTERIHLTTVSKGRGTVDIIRTAYYIHDPAGLQL